MTDYLVAIGVVFGVNLLPAFGPPTWALLVFFRLHYHVNAVALVLLGAVAAACGRLVLAHGARLLRGHLSPVRIDRLSSARDVLLARKTGALAALALFTVSPVPSAQLFLGAGLLDVRLLPATAAFFSGRLVSYSMYVALASVADQHLGNFVTQSLGSPWAISVQVALLAGLAALPFLDWHRILERRAARSKATGGAASSGTPSPEPNNPRPRVREEWLLVAAVCGLVAGAGAHLAGATGAEHAVWAATTAVGIVPAVWWMLDALRRRRLGVDLLALFALVGTLVAREYLAGAVITVMLATGRSLESRAGRRAEAALRSLAERVPRSARRHRDGQLVTVALDELVPGDLVLVGPGEVVPVDGLVEAGPAVLDESALTGEAVPVERAAGQAVRSGVVNGGGTFDLRATTPASESTYAGVIRLVDQAAANTAPFVRLADRWAGWFLLLSLAGAGAAWVVSGQFVRAVAVLVVATPCPLILAAPVAIVAGISRAAQLGVLVKSGAVLEQLARGKVLLFDKTGTLTLGSPRLDDIVCAGAVEPSEILRLAASLDQVSPHVMASAIVSAARSQSLVLSLPEEVQEVAGQGITGLVDHRRLSVGRASWAGATEGDPWVIDLRRRAELDGASTVFVSIDGVPAGALLLSDPIRPDAGRSIRALRRDGMSRIVMVSGDREDIVEAVAAIIGVDEVLAERSPQDKVDAVRAEQVGGPVIMVGDGINDAPALAAADVGVAIGARGASASSEAADVILNVSRLNRLGDAILVARRSRRIAYQSVAAGMAMSIGAMGAASLGLLAPTWGALLQEAIDVAVILNALRALRGGGGSVRMSAEQSEVARSFAADHARLRPRLAAIRAAADDLGSAGPGPTLAAVSRVHRFLSGAIEPHQEAEDAVLYPLLSRLIGGTDPLGPMSRAHVEISHQIRRLGRLLERVDPARPAVSDLIELRRCLYGLYAVLELHMAQEDEEYLSLSDESGSVPVGGVRSIHSGYRARDLVSEDPRRTPSGRGHAEAPETPDLISRDSVRPGQNTGGR